MSSLLLFCVFNYDKYVNEIRFCALAIEFELFSNCGAVQSRPDWAAFSRVTQVERCGVQLAEGCDELTPRPSIISFKVSRSARWFYLGGPPVADSLYLTLSSSASTHSPTPALLMALFSFRLSREIEYRPPLTSSSAPPTRHPQVTRPC